MIEYLNEKHIFDAFNKSKIKELLKGLKYEKTNDIGGHRGGILRR